MLLRKGYKINAAPMQQNAIVSKPIIPSLILSFQMMPPGAFPSNQETHPECEVSPKINATEIMQFSHVFTHFSVRWFLDPFAMHPIRRPRRSTSRDLGHSNLLIAEIGLLRSRWEPSPHHPRPRPPGDGSPLSISAVCSAHYWLSASSGQSGAGANGECIAAAAPCLRLEQLPRLSVRGGAAPTMCVCLFDVRRCLPAVCLSSPSSAVQCSAAVSELRRKVSARRTAF